MLSITYTLIYIQYKPWDEMVWGTIQAQLSVVNVTRDPLAGKNSIEMWTAGLFEARYCQCDDGKAVVKGSGGLIETVYMLCHESQHKM